MESVRRGHLGGQLSGSAAPIITGSGGGSAGAALVLIGLVDDSVPFAASDGLHRPITIPVFMIAQMEAVIQRANRRGRTGRLYALTIVLTPTEDKNTEEA